MADFGLARFLTQEALATTYCGTPLNMAPEVFHKMDSYSDQADIWSLGTVLYEMLHGYPPFNVRNARELVAAHS